jgi:hypothetical protein
MADRPMNFTVLNKELESQDQLLSEAKDLLKDIEKIATGSLADKLKICEKSTTPTNQIAFFPVAFRNPDARNMADLVFAKALGLIRNELLEKYVDRYNELVERLNASGNTRFSRIG